jgi:hypothetical protein
MRPNHDPGATPDGSAVSGLGHAGNPFTSAQHQAIISRDHRQIPNPFHASQD